MLTLVISLNIMSQKILFSELQQNYQYQFCEN